MSETGGWSYLNGDFVALAEARISPLDRGFLFSDGVYEVIPVYAGHLYAWQRHLRRLHASLAAVRMPARSSDGELTRALETLIRLNGGGDLAVYLQITRGAPPRRDHVFPAATEPTEFAMCSPFPRRQGDGAIQAVTAADERWANCHIKSVSLLPNVLARSAAGAAGAQEAILIRDDEVTEGAASNVFLVKDGGLRTPARSRRILPGITREIVLELAREDGLDCAEAPIPARDLREADELWITSTTREIAPVVRLDGARVGKGEPGPVWRRVDSLFQASKNRSHNSH